MKMQMLILVITLVMLTSCKQSGPKQEDISTDDIATELNSNKNLPQGDTIIILDGRECMIKIPAHKSKKGTFLLLHGWNLPPDDWCSKTNFCDLILQEGYCIVLPDMGKSNYQTQVFSETRKEWKSMPGLLWLTDTLIPYLQLLCLIAEGERNFIAGISTGGRGVVSVCQHLPGLFTGAAALSGDFDQTFMPHDKVHIGYYGSFDHFPLRWKTIDNPMHRIKDMKTPIYLGHGLKDKVTDFSQSKMFYDSLRKFHPELFIQLNLVDAGHDYHYWSSETNNIMSFFQQIP